MVEEKKRRGRPSLSEAERKRNNVTFRARDSLKEDLEEAAAASGRSVSEEIEFRLELSLARRDDLVEKWGEDVFNIAESMAKTLWHIERHAGARWVEDDRAADLFKRSTVALIENYRDILQVNRRDRPSDLKIDEAATPEELARAFAALGGLTPPRLRRGAQVDPERERAERRHNLETWKRAIEARNSRPLPQDEPGRDE